MIDIESLKGESVHAMDFQDLKWVRDLEYYDGPLISLFTNPEGRHFIYFWVDKNKLYHRWLVFEINSSVLMAFEINENYLQLIKSRVRDLFYLVDIDTNLNHINHKKLGFKEIPSYYLPKP